MPSFVHLHNHTEFSLLDGAAKIADMTQKACDCGMSHVAITDHGNMFGVPKFVLSARGKGLTPIVGCEFYITANKATEQIKGDKRYHQIMWAMNAAGYRNLVKLCSYGYTDGYYYKPRIDKDILREHSEGLLASTCCLASEVNQTFLKKGEAEGEAKLMEYLDLFGKENYYVEVQRHTLGDMDKCNEWLLRMAKKHDLTVIATNDVHYVNEEDAEAHDLLLALQTQSDYSDPNRFRFTDDQNRLNPRFFFKTQDQMANLFKDIPQALENTVGLAERCTFEMNLAGDMILPQYKVPSEFGSMDDYLRHMVWQRAPKRYAEISSEVQERIEQELQIVKKMGYAGYFLIVQSFTTEARKRGVYVGPGRGSAAGSVVAYVLGIIDIDPLKYDLLFERFLNPERVSPPDIDIDFDDEGRQEVIDFVVEEYGRKSVSQVITYGTMGAKTALRDVGRTLQIPLAEVNRIAGMIPDRPGMSFKKALDSDNNPDHADELGNLFESKDPMINRMMRYAKTLEGTARHTGVHACAVIIAPGDITDYAPVAVGRDKTITTQYDGPMAEMAGLLKMDFLGLRTLSILKTAIKLVKENHGVELHPDDIPLEDVKTYELYQRGDTVATFQFESDGMRKYLRQLKPTNIEDLIAMNALYRPGPMDNIPSFVNRKHGREKIHYPHEMLEPILNNTYGIMVYQEQIMQVARTMGGYTMGGADLLRRAMGKKKMEIMAKEKVNFVNGAAEKGVDQKTADEVFALMEKFASYGFNKCLPGDTEVVDADTGQLVKIEDVYHGRATLRTTATLEVDSLKMQQGRVATVMDNGVKPVFKLITSSGKEIEATANHPFYTYEGWKQLGELVAGELIATPRVLPVEGKAVIPAEASSRGMALLTWNYRSHLGGEGDKLEANKVWETFEEILTWNTEGIDQALRCFWLHEPKFREKVGLGGRFLAENEIWVTDKLLLSRLHHLFLRLGLVTEMIPESGGWCLRMNREVWLDWMNPASQVLAAEALPSEVGGKRQRVTAHTGHGPARALGRYFDDPALDRLGKSDVYWDRIVSITYVGEKQTYDLEVPGTHNFVANDIIVHNSHSAAYSVLAFKTAYMKAHYPAEYMASVLTHNLSDIKKITFFMEECRRMGIQVLPPDINESQAAFSVNKDRQIRFGMEAIKGVGHAVVEAIIEQRKKEGPFESLFDLCVRMPLRSLNRKTLESLAYAGALDLFGVERFRYFLPMSEKETGNVLERAVQYGTKVQQEKMSPQASLFGEDLGGAGGGIQEPPIPTGTMNEGRIVEAWTELEKLNYEKDVIGFYLSGHPLDRFKWQMDAFLNCRLGDIEQLLQRPSRDLRFGGIVTSVRERISRRGNKFMSFVLEDFSGNYDFALFGEQYEKFRGLIRQDEMIFVSGVVQPRPYGDPNELEMRLIDIRLMSTDLFEGMIRRLCIKFDNGELDETLLQRLQAIFTKHKGNKDLMFQVRDESVAAEIRLVSSEWKVDPTGELVRDLEDLGVEYGFV